jgi:hypothetical protein
MKSFLKKRDEADVFRRVSSYERKACHADCFKLLFLEHGDSISIFPPPLDPLPPGEGKMRIIGLHPLPPGEKRISIIIFRPDNLFQFLIGLKEQNRILYV